MVGCYNQNNRYSKTNREWWTNSVNVYDVNARNSWAGWQRAGKERLLRGEPVRGAPGRSPLQPLCRIHDLSQVRFGGEQDLGHGSCFKGIRNHFRVHNAVMAM